MPQARFVPTERARIVEVRLIMFVKQQNLANLLACFFAFLRATAFWRA